MNKPSNSPVNSYIDLARLLGSVGVVLAVISLAWTLGDPVSMNQRLLSALVMLVSLLPLCFYFANRARSPYMIFELHCAWYALCFGMNGFFEVVQKEALVSIDSGVVALELTLTGLLVMMGSYAAARRWLFNGYSHYNPFGNASTGQVEVFGWIATSLSLSSILVPAIASLPSIGVLVQISSLVGAGILYAIYLRGRLNPISSILFFLAVVPLETVARLNTGSVAHVMLFYMMMFVVRLSVLNRVSIFLPIIVFGSFILVNPVKMQYRKIVWNPQTAAQMSSFDKTALFIELMGDYWLEGRGGNERAEENIRNRTDNLILLKIVQDATPTAVPYWNGETYESALFVVVPRFLWPGKPPIVTGNSFGHRYFILHESDMTTSINLPWLVEAYANFGVEGVIGVMGLIGIAFAYLKHMFGNPIISRLNSVLYLCLTISLAVPESSLVGSWGGLAFSLVFFLSLAKLLASSNTPARS